MLFKLMKSYIWNQGILKKIKDLGDCSKCKDLLL